MLWVSKSATDRREGRPRIGWSRRWLACAVMAVGVLTVAAGAIAPSASADPTTTAEISSLLKNWQTSKCVENPAGVEIVMKDCTPNSPGKQKWGLYWAENKAGSAYRIVNEETNNCLVPNPVGGVTAIHKDFCTGPASWWWVDGGLTNYKKPDGSDFAWGAMVQLHSNGYFGCLEHKAEGAFELNGTCSDESLNQRWEFGFTAPVAAS